MKNSGLFAFLGGAVIGAAVALLLAPEKGADTRERIKEMIESEHDKLNECIKKHIDKKTEPAE